MINVNAYFTYHIQRKVLVMVMVTFGCNTPASSEVLGCSLREEYVGLWTHLFLVLE
jgi:hypothetical protein